MKNLLTTAEAAALAGVSASRIRQVVNRPGGPVGEKRGRDWWIDPASLKRWSKMANHKPGPKPKK